MGHSQSSRSQLLWIAMLRVFSALSQSSTTDSKITVGMIQTHELLPEAGERSRQANLMALWVLAGTSVTLDILGISIFLWAHLPPIACAHALIWLPQNIREGNLNTLVFQGRPSGLRGCKWQPGSGGSLHSTKDKQTQAGLTLHGNSFLPHLTCFVTATCLVLFTWRGLDLSLPFQLFVKGELPTLSSLGIWRPTQEMHLLSTAQSVSMQTEGQRTKAVQGNSPALLVAEIGVPQWRGEKPGRRIVYIITEQLFTPPPPFSKLLSSFYVITFH